MKDFQNDVRLARKGDTEAFSRLYSIVYKDMYHAALYNLRNQHDAYDIVSEAVIDAFSTIGKLKNEEAFKSWIMKILFAKIRKQLIKLHFPNLILNPVSLKRRLIILMMNQGEFFRCPFWEDTRARKLRKYMG